MVNNDNLRIYMNMFAKEVHDNPELLEVSGDEA